MGIKITGLDEMRRNLQSLASRAERLDGTHKVKFDDLFTSDFMRRFTDFLTIDELFEAGSFSIHRQEDLDAIDEKLLDVLIAERTLFDSWADMKEKAAAEWIASQLGLG